MKLTNDYNSITTTTTTIDENEFPIYASEARSLNMTTAEKHMCAKLNKRIREAAKQGDTFICVDISDKHERDKKLAKKYYEDRGYKVLMSNDWLVISWEEGETTTHTYPNTPPYPSWPPIYQTDDAPDYNGIGPVTCVY